MEAERETQLSIVVGEGMESREEPGTREKFRMKRMNLYIGGGRVATTEGVPEPAEIGKVW